MSGMNEYLSEFYGTNKTAAAETATGEAVEAAATYELFAKLAADNGIDLNALPDDKIAELYAKTFADKTAKAHAFEGKETPEEEALEEKELHEHAKKEHEEKKAAAEKFAEADFLGRQMAHAYVDELKKIAAAGAMPPAFAAHMKGKEEEGAKHEGHESKKEEKEEHKKEESKKEEHKEASAIDALAARRAVGMAKEAGYDPAVAEARVNAVLVLGLGDSVKVASAPDVQNAVQVRALEVLEAAGYPVEWQ